MKLSFLYLLLAAYFAYISFSGVPRYGCFNGVCADFHSINLNVIAYVALSLLFSLLGLKRLFKITKLKQINKYGSNDLSNIDG